MNELKIFLDGNLPETLSVILFVFCNILWFIIQKKVNRSGITLTTIVKETKDSLLGLVKNNETKTAKDITVVAETIEKAVQRFENSTVLQQAQPQKIKAIAIAIDEIKEMQVISFEMLDYFMFKNTNDPEIKKLCAKYKVAMEKYNSKTLTQYIDEIEAETPVVIDNIKNIPKEAKQEV